LNRMTQTIRVLARSTAWRRAGARLRDIDWSLVVET
jgi:hypothetical protein